MRFIRRPMGMLPFLPRWVVAGILGFVAPVHAEETAQLDSLFQLERSGAWREAADGYAAWQTAEGKVDSVTFFRARALYHAGDIDRALLLFTKYIAHDPNAVYRGEARLLSGNCQYRRGDHTAALASYVQAYASAQAGETNRTAKAAILSLFRSASEIYPEPGWFDLLDAQRRCELIDTLVALRLQRGDNKGAERLRLICTPAGDDRARPSTGDSHLRIALLLPLRGDLASYSEELMVGVTAALETARKIEKRDITIIPYDTEGDPLIAGRLTRKVIDDGTIDAIIGPLTSTEAAVVAATARTGQIPVIIPAAADGGFAEVGRHVWQFTPGIEYQASECARYARESEKADTALVIAPDAPHYRRMSEVFASEFRSQGGTILGMIHYGERERDFGKYLRDLKRLVRPIAHDSLRYLSAAGDTLEPSATPARIDCLYLPGEADQLRLFLPQLLFNNVSATLIGSDGWVNAEVLHLDNRITSHARIPTHAGADSSAVRDIRFDAAMREANVPKPGHLSRLGWDAVMFLHGASLADGKSDRAEIIASLTQSTEFLGATGLMRFATDGSNRELHFFRITDNKLVRIAEPAIAGDADGTR